MAIGDLTTLANVKSWVNLSGTGDDVLLARLITSVSSFIQSWLNRSLASSQYSEIYDGTGSERLLLSNYPVTAVASVTIDGLSVPVSSNPTMAGYSFDMYGVILRGGYCFKGNAKSGWQNVAVSYTAGYVVVPVEIEQSAIELVSMRYAERSRPGVTSRTVGGESVGYMDKGMSDSVLLMLSQYKKVVPI